MKKVKKIKWENVIVLILGVLFLISMIQHIKLNGVYSDLPLEVILYSIITINFYYIVKHIRKNVKDWTF